MKILTFLRSKLGLAVNQAADRCFAYALATNIAPMPSSGEWLPLPEYGDVDYPVATKGGGVRKMIQRFTPAQASKMQQRLQAVHAREGDDFRGLPIYVGHPPADSKRWPDERRLGHVLEIDANPARARVRVALNALGKQNQAEGFWVYPSPGWNYSEAEAARTGVILPDELHHIGMTNDPRMTTAKPWTNAAGDLTTEGTEGTEGKADECECPECKATFSGKDAAKDADGKAQCPDCAKKSQTTATNQNDPHMKKHLLKILGLADSATDAEIETAALAFNAKPAEPIALSLAINGKTHALSLATAAPAELATDITALETALGTAQAGETKFRTLAINSTIATAINGRKISAAEQKEWEQKLATNFDEAAGQLAAKAAALPNEALKLTKRADDISTPQGRQLAFNTRITALTLPAAQGGKGLSIDDAITAMRADKDDAELLKAMQPAK